MTERPDIPEHDRHLKLARTIGSHLESGLPISEMETDDPLVSLLQEYRHRIEQDSTKFSPDSAGIWSRIREQTEPTTDTDDATAGASIHTIGTAATSERRWIWAAAASLLIIVIAGYFYFLAPTQPTLIAETQQIQQTVSLADGSQVTLRPYSRLYLVEENSGGIQYELTGEGYFDVTKDPNRTFSVTAGNGRVSVLGTRFVLSNWGTLVQVYLEEGSVRLETADQSQSTILEPGHFATITENRNIGEPRPADISMFTDWLNNELSFRNREAEYVFSELEQHYNIQINAPEAVSDTRIGGTLSLARLDSSLNDLGVVLGGSFNETGEGIYRFVPDEQ